MNNEIIFRIIFISVFIITLAISAYYRKRARESGEVIPRLKEGILALAGRLIIGLTLLGFILAYTFFPDWIRWSNIEIHFWIRWIGVGFAVFCPPLSVWIFKNIGKNISETILTKQNHQLVTTGPYKWVRHPLYTMGILLILSLGMIAANWIFLLLALIAIIIFRFVVIPKEEKQLLNKFGEEYERYQRATGSLFPRL